MTFVSVNETVRVQEARKPREAVAIGRHEGMSALRRDDCPGDFADCVDCVSRGREFAWRCACSVRGHDRAAGEDQAAPSNRNPGLSWYSGRSLPDAAAVRATIPDIGCRPSGPSATGSAVLHASQLLPVFFGDRGG